MTEEEYFRKNYPDFCYGDKPLSPHWDFFQDGVEFGERQSENKIEEIENQNKLLCERCNQLLKDKGDLTDFNSRLLSQISATTKRVIKLEQQIEIEKTARIANVSKIYELEQRIEKMKCDVKQEQSRWNSCEMQYDLYQRLLDKWEIKENESENTFTIT